MDDNVLNWKMDGRYITSATGAITVVGSQAGQNMSYGTDKYL